MTTIGLTGGIASGKSTAARYLEHKGAHIIDADKLGHRAYEPETLTQQRIVDIFGSEVRTEEGEIDRRALGAKVFEQPSLLKQLTDIVWPEIRRLAEEEIRAERVKKTGHIIVLEAAVLLEAGWEAIVDELWVVTVERDTAVQRAMSRDGADEKAVQRRIDAQLSNGERIQRADVVIDNSKGEKQLYEALDGQWQALQKRVMSRADNAP